MGSISKLSDQKSKNGLTLRLNQETNRWEYNGQELLFKVDHDGVIATAGYDAALGLKKEVPQGYWIMAGARPSYDGDQAWLGLESDYYLVESFVLRPNIHGCGFPREYNIFKDHPFFEYLYFLAK